MTRITKFSVFPCELSLTIYFSKRNSNRREHQRQTALLKVPLYLAVTSQLRARVQVSPSVGPPLPAVSEKACLCSCGRLPHAVSGLPSDLSATQVQHWEQGIYYHPTAQRVSLAVCFRLWTRRGAETGKIVFRSIQIFIVHIQSLNQSANSLQEEL